MLGMIPPILLSALNDEQRGLIERIYERDSKTMLQTAMKYVKEQSTAEDIVQQVFVKILRQIEEKNIDLCSKTTGYFVIMVKNHCIDHLRAQKNQDLSYDAMLYEGGAFESRASDLGDPSELIISREGYDRIIGAIRQLDEKYLLPIQLKLLHGLSEKQIAETLGLSEKNVNSRIYRARKLLIEQIRKGVSE
ncbi:MAG: sigma-70 family RNA polymerase sigma factor [Peptostreptococcaceae bacterium]|nr:sigma-70 family RNA polymerase sigma factor [Peptostreptococcaceae bacterium]